MCPPNIVDVCPRRGEGHLGDSEVGESGLRRPPPVTEIRRFRGTTRDHLLAGIDLVVIVSGGSENGPRPPLDAPAATRKRYVFSGMSGVAV
jgi:hypothetical protein